MKTESLRKALALCKPSLGPNDSSVPILNHFCFAGDGMIYAYNMVTAIIVSEATGLSCAVQGDPLVAVLDTIKDEDVSISMVGQDAVRIKTTGGSVKLAALDLAQSPFEQFAPPDEEPIVSIPLTADFIAALTLCMIGVGEDSLKPEFAGVTIHVEGPVLTLYSTNNKTASRAILPFADEAAAFAGVLPTQACNLLLGLAKALGTEGATLSFAQEFASGVFDDGRVMLISKLLESKIDIYDKVFTQHTADAWVEVPDVLLVEIDRAVIVTMRDVARRIILRADGKTLRVEAAGTFGTLAAKLPVILTPGELETDPTLIAGALAVGLDVMSLQGGRSIQFASNDGTNEFVHVIAGSNPLKDAAPEEAAPPAKTRLPVKRQGPPDEDDIPF